MKTLRELKEELAILENNPLNINSDGMPSFSGFFAYFSPLHYWLARRKRNKQIKKLKLQIQNLEKPL